MSELISVKGRCKPLFGKIKINGSKNAVLPIMAASLLSSSPVTLTNVPDLTDVRNMSNLLENFGAKLIFDVNKNDDKSNHRLKIDCSYLTNDEIISYDVTNKLRASVLTVGPIIGRLKKINTAIPGGCKIGERPIDMHIKALQEMGAIIKNNGNEISGTVDKNLRGVDIIFEKRSIGATENVIMAATLADGVTTIDNAAIEPEVKDLISFLNKMGAKIYFDESSSRVRITGVKSLTGSSHRIIPDRIEAGTYALAAVITNGKIELEGISLSDIGCMAKELEAIGACLESRGDSIIVSRKNGPIKPIKVETNSYPNFPSDMQPQLMSALCIANGVSIIKENIFEDRLNHVYELIKLGADISVKNNNQAIIRGPKILSGNHLTATDLRSTAALILASLAADGETVIYNSHYLSRGYEAMPEKLGLCGADISLFERLAVPEKI